MPELRILRKVLISALLAALACLLSGCIVQTVDELYALPRHSDAYNELQNAIDGAMEEGVQYAAPISGGNRQSVQLADLDGDGEEEAIVFVRRAGDAPLCAYVFDLTEDTYSCIGSIEGSGAAFDRVEYAALDDEPGLEILLGRQLSDQVVRAMSVYSLSGGALTERMSANYSEYALADLDADGRQELLLLRLDSESDTGTAELYLWQDGVLALRQQSALSRSVQSIRRVLTGEAWRGQPAVFVESICAQSDAVTDVFTLKDGTLCNFAPQNAALRHSGLVYTEDVDGDGLIEIPQLVTPPNAGNDAESVCIIRWQQLLPGGTLRSRHTTCHCFADGWFILLPDAWEDALTVSRGETGYVFSRWDEQTQTAEPAFTLYAFSGSTRAKLASEDGRFTVAEKGGVTYAASLGTGRWAAELTQERLREMFHFIQFDWKSGER